MRRMDRYGGREGLLAISGSTCLWQAEDSSPTLGTGSAILAYLSLRGTFLLRHCEALSPLVIARHDSAEANYVVDSGIDRTNILN
jgi:hypothetical protein